MIHFSGIWVEKKGEEKWREITEVIQNPNPGL